MSKPDPKDKSVSSLSSAEALAATMDSVQRRARPFADSDADTMLAEEEEAKKGTLTEIVGTVLNDRYTVTRKIGQGGMGAVYEATHNLIGKRVALKVLLDKHAQNDQVVARLKQEARLASSIGHQNIIDITDFGTTASGRTFVVMEYLEGESLGARIAKDGRLGSAEVLHIAKQVAGALAAAHLKGIVHRDIKPENIFIVSKEEGDFVKVVDFGISKSMSEQQDDEMRLTQTGMVLGTPLYMSPEQARGDDDLDHRIDIYALGVLLYESLTGEVPFQGKNYLSILTQVTSETPKSPCELVPDIDRDLESITLKAMAKDRDERYQSMEEFVADLEALQEPGLNTTSGRIVAARWRRRKERSPIWTYAAGLALIMGIAGASVWGVGALMAADSVPASQDASVAAAVVLPPVPDVRVAEVVPPKPEESTTVRLTIQSEPEGVAIYQGERTRCETTPCTLEFLRDSDAIVLRGSLEGYEDGRLPITPSIDAGKVLTIRLTKSTTRKGKGKKQSGESGKNGPKTKSNGDNKDNTPNKDKARNGGGELQSNPFGSKPQ